MPDNIALFAAVILLLPMMYFLLAAPAFLLVKLDVRPVAVLLRTMFSGYFMMLSVAGAVGMVAVALEGRLLLALAIGLVAALAAASRRWFLQRMDAQLGDDDAAAAARELRRLHWGGMLSNAVQLGVLVASIPQIAVAP